MIHVAEPDIWVEIENSVEIENFHFEFLNATDCLPIIIAAVSIVISYPWFSLWNEVDRKR